MKKAAKRLWEYELQEMGLRLFKFSLNDISRGVLIKKPQPKEYSTFEPNTDVKDVFKPDLLMLEQNCGT
jgi:methionyl-tRNA formyltransferase